MADEQELKRLLHAAAYGDPLPEGKVVVARVVFYVGDADAVEKQLNASLPEGWRHMRSHSIRVVKVASTATASPVDLTVFTKATKELSRG